MAWVQAQSWHDLLFAHWRLPVDVLRAAIPSELELDTFDGEAWIGVVPFRMSGVRLRGTPALPWLSAFEELNVRTYVRHEGKPGVWFFSLDAAHPVIVGIARAWYSLPYFRARMSIEPDGDGVRYRSARTHRGVPSAEFEGRYRPTGPARPAEPASLDHWLTERYCLYALARRGLLRADIEHDPWPLQPAEAEIVTDTMIAAAGLPTPEGEPLLHFARRVDMVAEMPAPVTR